MLAKYGMGVAVGDYTGNGYPDIYVLNFGPNQLWRNQWRRDLYRCHRGGRLWVIRAGA